MESGQVLDPACVTKVILHVSALSLGSGFEIYLKQGASAQGGAAECRIGDGRGTFEEMWWVGLEVRQSEGGERVRERWLR